MNQDLRTELLLQGRLLEFMSIEEFNVFCITQAADYLRLSAAAANGLPFLVRRTPNGFAIKIA